MATTGTFLKPIFIAGVSYPVGEATIDDALVSQIPRDTFVPTVEPVTGGEDDVKARRAAGFLDTGIAEGKVPVWNATQKKYIPGTVASEGSASVAAADITDASASGVTVLTGTPAQAQRAIAIAVGTTYAATPTTLAAADCGKIANINLATAASVVLPADADAAIAIGDSGMVMQGGVGAVTISAGSGATMISASGANVTSGQYSLRVWLKTAANTYLVF